jgi:quercetin dioxygenase-like cupin family protein
VSVFTSLSEVDPQPLGPGVLARALHGDRSSFLYAELEPGCALAAHEHDNEQLGMLLRGSMEFRVGDEVRQVRAGDAWVIPAGVPHEVTRTGEDGAVVIEGFAPARNDWRALERVAPRDLRWPLEEND